MPRAKPQTRLSRRASPARPSTPYVFSRLTPVQTTPVYDTYWRFAAERQAVLLRRARGAPAPWTMDAVLRHHKFTNAYRAADRVSQFLIAKVIYQGPDQADEVVFRTLLFKLFNKIETWHLLRERLGELSWKRFDSSRYASVLSRARAAGTSIYSPAYIMPSARSAFGCPEKHRNHLALIEHMMRDRVANRISKAASLGDVYVTLRSYPSLGPFLAFQLAIDLNYSPLIDFDEMSFVVPGPGARDGITKCFSARGGLSEVDLIKLVADRQDAEFEKRGLLFEYLAHRRLQLIDCQNLFCEVDKYARVVHPEVQGISGRTRIKQVFRARPEPLTLWFPPKWNVNEALSKQLRRERE